MFIIEYQNKMAPARLFDAEVGQSIMVTMKNRFGIIIAAFRELLRKIARGIRRLVRYLVGLFRR